MGSSARQYQPWTVGVTRWRSGLPYEVTGSLGIRLGCGFRQGLTCGPSASGSTFPRPRPPPTGRGRQQPGRASPRRASPALHQVPLQSRSPGQVPGSPTSHLPWCPPCKHRVHAGCVGYPGRGFLVVDPARVWGAGEDPTVAGASDNTTHPVGIPAWSGAHPLSPPHRATHRASLLGDPSTHPTGGQGHRGAGRQGSGQAGSAQTMSLTLRGERGGGGGR